VEASLWLLDERRQIGNVGSLGDLLDGNGGVDVSLVGHGEMVANS
jgi:hypothetical protein